MPTYVRVDVDIAYVRGFSKEYYSDIDSVLSELDILFSPNTSKVITRTLDSLAAFSTAKFSESTIFWSQFRQLSTYLNTIYIDRPCHAGLGWLMKIMKEFGEERFGSNISNAQNALKSIVQEIKYFRKSAKKQISEKANKIISHDVTNIFVVGFSSTVLDVLEAFAHQQAISSNNIKIYVMECSTKRRLVHSNLIEYSDGAHYAIKIGQLNNYKTELIPDFGFATILNSMLENDLPQEKLSKKCLVLFGANGIDEKSGACGHTSGHLMVAIVAKEFKIPVKIVSDSFKVGEIKWNHNAVRKGDWFATQKNIINELSDAHVNISNMREDCIPCKLITEIHTEDNCLPINREDCSSELLQKISSNVEEFYKKLIKIIEQAA